MGQAPLDLYNNIKSVYENNNIGYGDQAILRRIAIVAANGGIPFNFLNQVPHLKLTPKRFPCACLPLNDWNERTVDMSTIQKFINEFDTCFKYNTSEANLRLFLWNPLLMNLLTNGLEDEKSYVISSECSSNNFVEFQQISKRIDLALLSKRFNLPILQIEMGTDSIHYPFTHKDGSKMFSFITINCIALCKKMQENGIDPLEARVFGLFIGDTRFQFAVARPVIVEIEGKDESEIDNLISFLIIG